MLNSVGLEKIADFSKVVQGLVNLKTLNLSQNNNLKSISGRLLRDLVNLERLDLKKCAITEIESEATRSLQKLKYLDLSENKLTKGPSIENLVNLEHLDLSKNQIDSIDENVFGRQNLKLTMLDLSGNSLKALHGNSFLRLVALRSLSLAQNDLSGISIEAFSGLANLKELDLSSTELKVISSSLFSEIPRLEKLFLRNTTLEVIKKNAFSHFRDIVLVTFNASSFNSNLLKPLAEHNLVKLISHIETNLF
jgi:Leucine-rich repeat (LRR) protein